MELTLVPHALDPNSTDVDLLVAYVEDPASLPSCLHSLPPQVLAIIELEISRDRLRAGKGDVLVIAGAATGPKAIGLYTVGTSHDGDIEALRNVGGAMASTLRQRKATTALFTSTDAEHVPELIEGFTLGVYRHGEFKTRLPEDEQGAGQARRVAVEVPKTTLLACAPDGSALSGTTLDRAKQGFALAEATNWARDLANAPSNILTPVALANAAVKLADQYEYLTATILDRAAVEAEGMGLLAAVGQGSINEPQLIVLEWNPPQSGRSTEDRLAMVGKAVTFDTGGISIKPSAGMTEMKMDKAGGCAVLGAVRAIAEHNSPQPILAVIAAAENMPSGTAFKPGDVITAMDGTTVEVTNTDAEGRLVLGDAISYARKLGCSKIVELSTLTGAMVIALGHHFSGMIARKGEFADHVLEACTKTGDLAWHLPMHDAYKSALKSECADMVNSGPRPAGSLYAGLFLEHFARETPFVHLDVAGTAMLAKPQGYHLTKGASGWGVRALYELAQH